MPFTTINLGLELTIPTSGTRNWDQTLLNTTWTKISEHRHEGSGDGNQINTAGIADGAITSVKLAAGVRAFNQQATQTPATSLTIDWSNGEVVPIDMSSATSDITLGTPLNPTAGARYIILVTQSTTPRNLNYPIEFKFPGAQEPILSTANGEIDKLKLYYDGTDYYVDWDVDYS